MVALTLVPTLQIWINSWNYFGLVNSIVNIYVSLSMLIYCFLSPSLRLRYASLYFCCAIEQNDNELLTLEIIHRYVELLDKYFGSVSILTYLSLINKIDKNILIHFSCLLTSFRCVNWISYLILKRRISS